MRLFSRRTRLYVFQSLVARIASTSSKVKTRLVPLSQISPITQQDDRDGLLSMGEESNPLQVFANILIDTLGDAGNIRHFARYYPIEFKVYYKNVDMVGNRRCTAVFRSR